MHSIAIGQELPIDTLPADHINILRCIVFHGLQCLFHAVYHLGSPHFQCRICGKNDIFPSVKRLSQGKSLQRLSSVYDGLAHGLLSKHLMVRGNAHQELSLAADCPVLIYCYDCVHIYLSMPQLVCGPVRRISRRQILRCAPHL